MLRTLVVASAVIYTWGDLGYLQDLETGPEVAVGVAMYIPVILLAFSVRAAVLLWILVAVVSLLIVSVTAPHFVATAVVAVVLNAFASYTLSLRECIVYWSVFGCYAIAYASFVPRGFQILVVLGSLFVLAGLMGRVLVNYRRRWERETQQTERLKRIQKEVRAEERAVIAGELHDIVAHDITAITMQARRARFVEAAKRDEILELIGEAGQSTLKDLRRLLLVLKRTDEATLPTVKENFLDLPESAEEGATVSSVGLSDTVEQVADALRGVGMKVHMEIRGDLDSVPTVIRAVLRRTLRELGTNIIKHAEPGSPVDLGLLVSEDGVTVRTRNRVSHSERPVMSSGIGIEALKTRADVYGGTISIGMTADGDWATRVWLPLSSEG